VALAVVYSTEGRGAKRRFSVEPPERLYVRACVQYNKMAFSIERQ